MMTPEERNYLAGWTSRTQALQEDLCRDPIEARFMARATIRNTRALSSSWMDGWTDAALAAFGLDA